MRRTTVALTRFERNLNAQTGIALLAVLWAVTLLGLVALALTNSVQAEIRTATYRKEATQAYFLACGGVEAAILGIAYPLPENPDNPPFWTWQQGQREGSVPFQSGRARLEIVNESGKLDLNAASRRQLIRFFEVGGVEPVAARQLVAAILHWRGPVQPDDPEAISLDEYYQRGSVRPRHAPFQSVEEVLNVRGMSREIFFGTVEVSREGVVRPQRGLGQDLTVATSLTQVNVNYASEFVLRSLPEMSPELARAIIQERARAPFKSLEDIGRRTALSLPDEALPFLATGEGKTYSIVSVGELAGSRVQRAVRAVVQIDPQGIPRHRVVAWYDDYSSD